MSPRSPLEADDADMGRPAKRGRVELPRRFARNDRVVCRTPHGWAPGKVASIDEPNPEDERAPPLPKDVLHHPPVKRLIAVPADVSSTILPEVCFGLRQDGAYFTRDCLVPKGRCPPVLRFGVGDRVAVAVEDATGDFAASARGPRRRAVARPADPREAEAWRGRRARYAVDLDALAEPGASGGWSSPGAGGRVLVHRDDQFLVRDLALQPAAGAPRAAGTSRFNKRLNAAHGGWESIDHQSAPRKCAAPSDEDMDLEDE